MFDNIINKFKKICSYYEQLNELSEEKFNLIKRKEFEKADSLTKKESLLFHDLKMNLESMKKSVVENCKEKGESAFKLENLLSYMTTVDKEEILAYQRCAFSYEKKLKNSIKNNERLVELMMVRPQIYIESYKQLAEEQKANGKSLLKRKY